MPSFGSKELAAIQGRLALLSDAHYAMVFIKPKSDNWPLVREMCQKWGTVHEDKGAYFAFFNGDMRSLRGLQAIFRLTYEWKSALLFIGGEWVMNHSLGAWLDCYVQSAHAINASAYCLQEASTYFYNNMPSYISPCRFLTSLGKLSNAVPASLHEQVQALAVTAGVFRCPNFNLENFKVL